MLLKGQKMLGAFCRKQAPSHSLRGLSMTDTCVTSASMTLCWFLITLVDAEATYMGDSSINYEKKYFSNADSDNGEDQFNMTSV